MQEEVNAIEELNEAEIDQVSGGGAFGDTLEGVFRSISGWVGGGGTAKTPVCCGLLG